MTNFTDLIDELYAAFAVEPKPGLIDSCPCCMSSNALCTLIRTPLRQLNPEQLSKYAASVLLTSGSVENFQYFFPRILELSIIDESWWPSREVVLKKLVLANWDAWPVKQKTIIIETVCAVYKEELKRIPFRVDRIDSLLCGLALAKADLTPFLTILMQPENAEALYEFYAENSLSIQKGKLHNSFWADNRAAQTPIIKWLKSEPVQKIVIQVVQLRFE